MPPVKDFRDLKLKSQVLDSIFLFIFIETVDRTGYAKNIAEAFSRGGKNI
jgi:hypothetical protein